MYARNISIFFVTTSLFPRFAPVEHEATQVEYISSGVGLFIAYWIRSPSVPDRFTFMVLLAACP